MAGSYQPFLYDADKNGGDARFPTAVFDPKAVTRASYQSKPKKKKQRGPLISVNRHPDAHGVLGQRSNFQQMGRTTKNWIVRIRVVQLALRVLELIGATGLLVFMILINNIDTLTGWVLRVTFGVTMIHCIYGAYHMARPAGERTPGSSAAYHTFAAISDISVLPLYTYGALSAYRNGDSEWGTLLSDKAVLEWLIPAFYYTVIGAGGLHVVSLTISLWLGVMFRRICMMPPDMNPLEEHLTARPSHKRNKSSLATSSAYAASEKRLSTPLENYRRSGVPYEDDLNSRPPSVPFMHTRHGSTSDLASTHSRDSRIDLPSRRYQITPGNSPRSSATEAELKRMSAPPPRAPKPPMHSNSPSQYRNSYHHLPPSPRQSALSSRGSYTEIPLHETGSDVGGRPQSAYSSRPSSGTVTSYRATPVAITSAAAAVQPRAAKFTETWYASDSLINRTQQRNRAVNQMVLNATGKRRAYEALHQQAQEMPDSDGENENDDGTYGSVGAGAHNRRGGDENETENAGLGLGLGADSENHDDGADFEIDLAAAGYHPDPLRSHPSPSSSPASKKARRPNTPFRAAAGALAELDLNDRRVSGAGSSLYSHDAIATAASADTKNGTSAQGVLADERLLKPAALETRAARVRNSSIQADGGFYSKPYGDLKPGTPPVMQVVGGIDNNSNNNNNNSGRQVSSGNDYYAGNDSVGFRRVVSGKIAEEGRAGQHRFSRYSVLNED